MARPFSRRRSGPSRNRSQWKKNHWAVHANALSLSSSDEIVFVELMTPADYGSTEFLAAKATERRIRGWVEWSVAGDVAVGNSSAILYAYIAKIDQSTVDGAIASGIAAVLDPLDPELDEAYAGNSIMWTYWGTLLTSALNTDPDTISFQRVMRTEIDVPVARRLEGDETIYLVFKAVGSPNVNDIQTISITRILFQE